MIKLLTQAFPSTTRISSKIRTALVYGLFVFLFLSIFRPFGLDHPGTRVLFTTTLLYGLVCFVILVLCFLLLPALFPRFYREQGWVVWKEILHTLVCVGLVAIGNMVFTHFWFHVAFGMPLVLTFLFNTFSVSVLPVLFLIMLRQMRLMRRYSRGAGELNSRLPDAAHASSPTGEVMLPMPSAGASQLSHAGLHHPFIESEAGSPTNPPAVTTSTNFLYAEAADNYVRVFSVENGQPARQIVRNTLKNLEDEYRADPSIFRCHRTYIVNLARVIRVTGNAQGYKLHLEGIEEPIPVSRNLNREMTERFGSR